MTVQISKEFYKTCDAGSNEFIVTVHGNKHTPFTQIEGMARNIFEGNTFHLDDEFNDALEHFGIDPYDVVVALEAGDSTIECNDIKVPEVVVDSVLDKALQRAVDGVKYMIRSTLNLKSVEDGRSVSENGRIVGIMHDDVIVFDRDLKRLCKNAGLTEEWEFLTKHMKLED